MTATIYTKELAADFRREKSEDHSPVYSGVELAVLNPCLSTTQMTCPGPST